MANKKATTSTASISSRKSAEVLAPPPLIPPPPPDFELDRKSTLPIKRSEENAAVAIGVTAEMIKGASGFLEMLKEFEAGGCFRDEYDNADAILDGYLEQYMGVRVLHMPDTARGFFHAMAHHLMISGTGTMVPDAWTAEGLLTDNGYRRVPLIPRADVVTYHQGLHDRMDRALIDFSNDLEEVWQLSEAAIEVAEQLDGQESSLHARLMGLQKAVAQRLKETNLAGTAALFATLNEEV